MSTLEVSNLNDGTTTVATTYVTNGSAKVWANVNQVGTMAIRDSLNLSSITDSGNGTTRHSISSAMNNELYSVLATCTVQTTYDDNACAQEVTVSTYDIYCSNASNTNTDNGYAQTAVFGDLA